MITYHRRSCDRRKIAPVKGQNVYERSFFMKRTPVFVAAALAVALVLVATSCGSRATQPAEGGVPDFVMNALINAPEGVLIGIGAATSQAQAATYAKAQISNSLATIAVNMVTDWLATTEVFDFDAVLLFQEIMVDALFESTLQGASIVAEGTADDQYWVVVTLSGNNVIMEIASANEHAALLNPALGAAMGSVDRLDRALDRALLGEAYTV